MVDHKFNNNKLELVNKKLTQSSTLLMEAQGSNSWSDHIWNTVCSTSCQSFKREHNTPACPDKGNCGDGSGNRIYWRNDSRNQKCLAWIWEHLEKMSKLPSSTCSAAVKGEVNYLWCPRRQSKKEWMDATWAQFSVWNSLCHSHCWNKPWLWHWEFSEVSSHGRDPCMSKEGKVENIF